MTERAIRRAAEHKARKLAYKLSKQNGTADSPCSEAQLAANRANAQHSTGATSPEGKAISSRNHTTHGLTAVPTPNFKVHPDEDQSAYDQSLAAYQAEWKPATASEHDLINRLATHAWLRDRAIRLQNNILAEVGDMSAAADRKDFNLFMRYYLTHARAHAKAFSELLRLKGFQMRQEKHQLQIARQTMNTQIRFESQTQKAELHAAKMELLNLKQEAQKQQNHKPKTAQAPNSH